MPSSNPEEKKFTSRILRDDAQLKRILDFNQPKLQAGASEVAETFLEKQKLSTSDFKLSEITKSQSGIKQMEASILQREIEKRTLDQLKTIQEEAYQEAYNLGLLEGKREAFQAASKDIQDRLKLIDDLVGNMQKIKFELMKQNETHFVKLVLKIASRIAHREVQVNQDTVIEIIKSTLEMSQGDEKIIVHVSVDHLDFFVELQKSDNYNLDFLKKIKFVPHDQVTAGGCIIETNYGEVDSRIETRLQKLWENFEKALYPVKDIVSAA